MVILNWYLADLHAHCVSMYPI